MPYKFDRYVGGQLMAEGACIHHASTEAEAREKARRMFAGSAAPGEMERTVFVRVQECRPLAGDLKMDIVMRLAELAAVLSDGAANAQDAETVKAAATEIVRLRAALTKGERP